MDLARSTIHSPFSTQHPIGYRVRGARRKPVRLELMMTALKKFGIVAALVVLCIPFVRVQNQIEVDVNWSIQESAPSDHAVTIQDLTFTVPAGQSVKQPLHLKGGGRVAAIYTVRGWGLGGQQIKVDGKVVQLHQIKTSNERGALKIFGFGRAAAMDARIAM